MIASSSAASAVSSAGASSIFTSVSCSAAAAAAASSFCRRCASSSAPSSGTRRRMRRVRAWSVGLAISSAARVPRLLRSVKRTKLCGLSAQRAKSSREKPYSMDGMEASTMRGLGSDAMSSSDWQHCTWLNTKGFSRFLSKQLMTQSPIHSSWLLACSMLRKAISLQTATETGEPPLGTLSFSVAAACSRKRAISSTRPAVSAGISTSPCRATVSCSTLTRLTSRWLRGTVLVSAALYASVMRSEGRNCSSRRERLRWRSFLWLKSTA
mmetsp:Transcript_5527/g.21227  ORF Transcript_5527/g.21227 Transcript_5527/m.21227 type:complete len:268 (-) Transcript_5527:571-1374(-)